MPINPKKLYTVAELTEDIKALLEDRYGFIWISAEISNLKTAASGHVYFTLKDAKAQIGAVMFRGSARRLRQPLQDGMRVSAMGRISVYPPRGAYQFIAEHIELQGVGNLLMAIEALKRKLSAEGLFEAHTKKALPAMPKRVAVVTSLGGSVIQDILQVSGRRWSAIPIDIVPVTVQGDAAPGEIVSAVEMADSHGGADVLLLARGGGSVEDLMAFNDEAVARAVAACSIPVVSAIGHETDTTIVDLVADVRAPTPSAAAELVFPDRQEAAQLLVLIRRRLIKAFSDRLSMGRHHLETLTARLQHPSQRIAEGRLRVDDLVFRLEARMKAVIGRQHDRLSWRTERLTKLAEGDYFHRLNLKLEVLNNYLLKYFDIYINNRRKKIEHLTTRLRDLSPLGILQRGYSIIRPIPKGRPLRRFDEVGVGAAVEIQLAHGFLQANITAAGVETTAETGQDRK